MARFAPHSLTPLLVASFLFGSTPARAFEKQHHVGGGIAPGVLAVRSDGASPGIGLHAHYAYGLSDAFNFVSEAGGSLFPIKQVLPTDPKAARPAPRADFLGHVAVGAIYNLDVLKFVPYGGVLLGGYTFVGGGFGSPNFAGGAQVALGLDWHTSRSVGIGFGLRQHFIFTKITDYPSFTQLVVRLEYKWGG